jgi:hypothetical protein
MRERVCRLQLLLALASAVILRFESLGIHDRILLSQIRKPPTWRARSPYLYPPGRGYIYPFVKWALNNHVFASRVDGSEEPQFTSGLHL